MKTTASADGTTIAFDRYGEGPALVLVLGAFCDRMAPLSLAKVLAERFTVYTYDRRGRGDSTDTPPYDVMREVDDLAAVAEAAGGSAFVFGHSSGAALALTAAAQGLPVERLAVYEPPYFADGSRPRPERLAERLRALVESGRPAEAVRLFLRESVMVPDEALSAMEQSPTWQGLVGLAHTLAYDVEICGDCSIPREQLSRIAAPTLVLGGERSPDWFRTSMGEVAGALPDARQITLEGQDHGAADDVLAPVLAAFFLG